MTGEVSIAFCPIYHSPLFEQMQQIWVFSYLKQMIELSRTKQVAGFSKTKSTQLASEKFYFASPPTCSHFRN